jgi:aryl-alcohol dehydrogenase-like predicted oxidoreductase
VNDAIKPDRRHRRLGRTDQIGFIVGLGGISIMRLDVDAAVALINHALDSGVNHLDVAPTYGDAQAKMGRVLKQRRHEVFLSCKTLERDAARVRAELEESLRQLQTDRIDLYQMHALDSVADLEQVCAPGGALAAFHAARDEGLIRFIGVTGHNIATHLETITRLELDTVMAPLNFRTVAAMLGPAGLIARARRRGMGIIAIKATTRGEIKPTAAAYRFALSHDVDITMPAGAEAKAAIAVAKEFTPMSAREQAAFLAHCLEEYDPDKPF